MSDPKSRELPLDFSSFVVSLATSAMVHLGEAPDPATGERSTNVPLARHSIDVLGIIADKTKGNLDAEEQKLMETLLYECRTRFVQVVEREQTLGKNKA